MISEKYIRNNIVYYKLLSNFVKDKYKNLPYELLIYKIIEIRKLIKRIKKYSFNINNIKLKQEITNKYMSLTNFFIKEHFDTLIDFFADSQEDKILVKKILKEILDETK